MKAHARSIGFHSGHAKRTKFKLFDKVRFIGGYEGNNYHPDYQEIIGKEGYICEVDYTAISFPFEIKVNGVKYPVRLCEIEKVV